MQSRVEFICYMQVIHVCTHIYLFNVTYVYIYFATLVWYMHVCTHIRAHACTHAHTVLGNTPRYYKKLASSDTNNSTEY